MNEKAHSVFKTAQIYADAARHLNGVFPTMLIPSTVMAALSLELSFKTLYLLEFNKDFKVNGRHSHDFFTLFEELPQATRDELVRGFDALMAKRDNRDLAIFQTEGGVTVSLDLASNLKQWRTVFTDLRYVHEFTAKSAANPKPGYWLFFPEIHAAVSEASVKRGKAS